MSWVTSEDESFQATDCTGTDSQTHDNQKQKRIKNTKKTNKSK